MRPSSLSHKFRARELMLLIYYMPSGAEEEKRARRKKKRRAGILIYMAVSSQHPSLPFLFLAPEMA